MQIRASRTEDFHIDMILSVSLSCSHDTCTRYTFDTYCFVFLQNINIMHISEAPMQCYISQKEIAKDATVIHISETPHLNRNWYFSRKEIEHNTPSRSDGIDYKQEQHLRKLYCSFLQELGIELKV